MESLCRRCQERDLATDQTLVLKLVAGTPSAERYPLLPLKHSSRGCHVGGALGHSVAYHHRSVVLNQPQRPGDGCALGPKIEKA